MCRPTLGRSRRSHWRAGYPELQAQLDRFTDYYNHIRPHRAVGRKPPITAYTARPKAVPTPPAPAPPARHFRVRVDRIDDTGVVSLRHNSRLHHIGIGRGHAGTRVTLRSPTCTSGSSPTTATCCANWSSTPAGTTNHNAAQFRSCTVRCTGSRPV